MKNDIKMEGSLPLKKIDYKRILLRNVSKNNLSSGKVNLPKELIGKQVYIVVPK